MRLNPVTWLIVLTAGLSLAADLIQWALAGQAALSLPEINGQDLTAPEWLATLGPSVAWLLRSMAATLWLFSMAVWVETLSRIHRRLRAHNAV